MKKLLKFSNHKGRIFASAVLSLLTVSLIGCGDEQQVGNDPYPYDDYRQGSQPNFSNPSSAPAPTPFPDFYGNGPGGSFYGN